MNGNGTEAIRGDAGRELEEQVFNRYGEVFPNYAWTDARTAVDLLVAEALTARKERDRLRTALAPFVRQTAHVRSYHASRDINGEEWPITNTSGVRLYWSDIERARVALAALSEFPAPQTEAEG